MRKSDFNFDLPESLIAQRPSSPRDAARLMCLNRADDSIGHHIFHELPDLLRPGDLLVLNDTRVLPARLLGSRAPSGGSCELLLLRETGQDRWICLAKPGKRLKPGAEVQFGEGRLTATILEDLTDGRKLVAFSAAQQDVREAIEALGRMPLPPYIKSQIEKNEDYQTVYARYQGSAAAPTAGLHFTPELFQRLAERGINTTFLTLHVGLGTFRPVQADAIEDHKMHSEWYSISQEAANAINGTKSAGNRVIAVGTTSCRTLESVTQKDGRVHPGSGETDIFLYPGSTFHIVDGLVTNFHLPESTLIMLVAAFYGLDKTMRAYRAAVEEQYRFFSFGDAMLLL